MIQRMKSTHLDAVMELWMQCNLQAHAFIPESYWKTQAGAVRAAILDADVWVLERDGQLIGLIGIVESYIAGLFVSPKFQGQGIGARLLAHCQQRYAFLELDVYAQNERAVRFYKRHGFQIIRSGPAETGEPEHRMRWRKESR